MKAQDMDTWFRPNRDLPDKSAPRSRRDCYKISGDIARMIMGNREQVAELISSLELATFMAQQIGTAVEQNQLLQISSSLRIAQHRLSAFLSTIPSSKADKSLSSVEPMQLGEEENGEAEAAVEKMEEKMRECFIRNKRAKRPLSPSSAVVETSATEERSGRDYGFDLDPHSTKLRALDLIYQFHG